MLSTSTITPTSGSKRHANATKRQPEGKGMKDSPIFAGPDTTTDSLTEIIEKFNTTIHFYHTLIDTQQLRRTKS